MTDEQLNRLETMLTRFSNDMGNILIEYKKLDCKAEKRLIDIKCGKSINKAKELGDD